MQRDTSTNTARAQRRRRLIAVLAALVCAVGLIPVSAASPAAAQTPPNSTSTTTTTTSVPDDATNDSTTTSTPASTTTPPIDSTTTTPADTTEDEPDDDSDSTTTTADPNDGELTDPDSTTTVAPDGEEVPEGALRAATTQRFDPASAVAGDSTEVVLTLDGSNQSDAPVDSMVLQVPVDDPPPSSTNPFRYLVLSEIGTVSVPAGADEAQVDVRSNGTWVSGPVGPTAVLPSEIDERSVDGVRFTFSDTDDSGIAAGASASAQIELELRDDIESDDDIPFDATASTVVSRDGVTASDDADATFTIVAAQEEPGDEDVEVGPTTSSAAAMIEEAIDIVIAALIVPGEISGSLSIQKVADVSDVVPGQTFNYTIQLQCTTATVTGCLNATVTDLLPTLLIPAGPVQVTGASTPPLVDEGPPLVITFQDDLEDGQIGLAAGEIITITIPVRVDPTIPVDQDGVPIVNTATVDAENADPKEGTATVTPAVAPTIAAGTSKQYTPDAALIGSTDPVTLSITGSNNSNVPVETMVIQDPVDDPPSESAAENPFGYLAVTGLGAVTLPDGADTVQVEVYDITTGAWVAGPVGPPAELPPTVAADNIIGIRYTFTSTSDPGIAPGATASIDVNLQQRDRSLIPDPPPGGSLQIDNDVRTTVTDPTGRTDFADATANFQIRTSDILVSAGKDITPSVVNAGDPATVTLTGTNETPGEALLPMTSMTITEPDPLQIPNPLGNGLTFTGFTDGVVWPTGADEATIIYECGGIDNPPQPTTTVDTLPDPDPACDVTGFEITFTSSSPTGIAAGATATIPFSVDTDPDQTVDELLRLNVVRVDGSDSQGNSSRARAFDTIRTIVDRLAVDVDKSIIPGELPAQPGQIVTVQLNGNLAPFPESTVDADQIIVQEPGVLPDDQVPPWFEIFQPQSVTATPVPDCSSLTVEYTTNPNGGDWQPISPALTDISGPTIVNQVIPDDVSESAQAIRFVYTADPAGGNCQGGFPPGTSVAPNIAFSLRPEAAASINSSGQTVTYTDCASSSANRAPDLDATSGQVCDDLAIFPSDPAGLGAIDKAWDENIVLSRSQAQVGATISWSTQNYTGLGRVEISDMADAANVPLASSVYDTFDLVRIDAIPSGTASDPVLTYDQITSVELLQLGSTWIDAPGDPCPAACDGVFPGYTVPDNLLATTIGFRLTYIESPTRVDRITAGAPPVGTGVAPSVGNNRQIHPVFELRDVRRSNPAIPVIQGNVYNTANAGEVLNSAGGDAFLEPDDTDPVQRYTASDTIEITDVPVTVNSTKTWDGGPLGIPAAGVAQDQYPTSRITLTGTNTTPAKIDQLVITDDTNGDAFEWFNLVGFTEITPPGDIGADDVTITLDGPTPTDYTRTAALALTEADLTDVTGIVVTYTGRINVGDPDPAIATVVFDARLRTDSRTDGTPPSDGQTVSNQVTVGGEDLVDFDNLPNPGNWTGSSTANDTIDLVAQGIGVTASKSTNPATLTEPDDGPVTVTLGGQPSGPSRTVEMVLTDDDPRFWNQYDFAALGNVSFTFPVDRVRVDALTGGTWELQAGAPVVTGATWQNGTTTPGPGLTLPAGVTAAQVQGLRYTFTRADGANWENPATPNQTISFQVTRRDDLNTGGGVPIQGLDPAAPGETESGRASNEMSAEVISSDVDVNGVPLSATGTATGTIDYLPANNAVGVTKTPDGSILPPGQSFTYTLEIENTGDVDITNPVVTDALPVDADGPMVVLSDDPNFTYTIDPGTVTTMPTDPADVTVTDTPTSIEFAFPDGSTLPIGATYTIAFDVFPRPGLEAAVPFTNTFGVTGDRPWNECSPGTLDPDTGQCQASATNQVSVAGAMAVNKFVRAEGSDVLGVTTDPLATPVGPCTADGAGFYGRPCVPIAEPGGDITWRMRFINTGNLPIDRILGIDTLPAVGDTLATVPALGRGSQWQPILTGEAPTLADPSFGTLNVWYTTGASTCDAVAPPVGGTAPNLLCPALGWTQATGGSIPTDATGIQVEIIPATVLAPGAATDVDLQMVAPAIAPGADVTAPQEQPDTQAYNTVGTSGRFLTPTQQESYTLVSERPRVGVALADGPLSVVKVVEGDAAQFAPDEYQADLSCTSVGVDVPLDAINPLTLVPDTPQTINNLPYGATCTLVEADAGQTSASSTTATVNREDQTIETVTLTNVYDDAPLSITKQVDSSAVDQDGTPVPYGPFEFTVDCNLDGAPVWADGYTETPMILTIDEGETVELTGIPIGATCTIEETDDEGAASKTITAVPPENVNPDGTVTLESDTAITVANAFTAGSVEITKVVTGNTSAAGAAGPFTVAVICVLDDPTGVRTVWDGDVILGGDEPLTATIDDLATGAVCQFEETESQGAETVTIEPADGVTVGDGTVVTLTVTNEFPPDPTTTTTAPPTTVPGGTLPSTGGSGFGRTLQIGILLLGAGIVLATVVRRRRTATDPA